MNRKLYVGNLPFKTPEEDLAVLFGQFGAVDEAIIIKEPGTERARGFGFVTMATEAAAQAAIDGLNQVEYEGRRLVVNVARPKSDGPNDRRREARW